MLKVDYVVDNKNCNLRVSGHAGHSIDPVQFDTVCGLVSILMQTALYGCTNNCPEVKYTVTNGFLGFRFPKKYTTAMKIAEACHYGIMEVKSQYPGCFE